MLSSMNTEAYTKLVERASAEGGTSVKLDSYERTASSMVPYSNELLINGKLQCVTRMMETLDKAVCAPEVLLQALKWLETCALNLYANPSRQEIATIARYQGPYIYYVQKMYQHESILEHLGYTEKDMTEQVFRQRQGQHIDHRSRATFFVELALGHLLLKNLIKACQGIHPAGEDVRINCATVLVALLSWLIDPCSTGELNRKMKEYKHERRLEDPRALINSLRTAARTTQHSHSSHAASHHASRAAEASSRSANISAGNTPPGEPPNQTAVALHSAQTHGGASVSRAPAHYEQMVACLPQPVMRGRGPQPGQGAAWTEDTNALHQSGQPRMTSSQSQIASHDRPTPVDLTANGSQGEEEEGEDLWTHLLERSRETESTIDESCSVPPAVPMHVYQQQGPHQVPASEAVVMSTAGMTPAEQIPRQHVRPHQAYYQADATGNPEVVGGLQWQHPSSQGGTMLSHGLGEHQRGPAAHPQATAHMQSRDVWQGQAEAVCHTRIPPGNQSPTLRPSAMNASQIRTHATAEVRPQLGSGGQRMEDDGPHTLRISLRDSNQTAPDQGQHSAYHQHPDVRSQEGSSMPARRTIGHADAVDPLCGSSQHLRQDLGVAIIRGDREKRFTEAMEQHVRCQFCHYSLAAVRCRACQLTLDEVCFNKHRTTLTCTESDSKEHDWFYLQDKERLRSYEHSKQERSSQYSRSSSFPSTDQPRASFV